MPKWGYSATGFDPETTVKASAREIRVSPKAAQEVCRTLKGMGLEEAKGLLEEVTQRRRAIPLRRSKKQVGHRRGLQGAYAGRYPTKTARRIRELLEEAEANAEFRGLDPERLRIVHAAAYPGRKIRRLVPRAMGRSSVESETLCHVEVVLEQRGET